MSEDDDWFERALREDEEEEAESESEPAQRPESEEREPSEPPEEGEPGPDGAFEGPTGEPASSGEEPFDQDFSAAFESAPGPDGGAAGESAGQEPFGGGGPFEEGEGGEFGFGGPPGETEFDEEEFESDIDRIELGIDGLDEMVLGGVPERALLTTIGSAGTGKTTFGMQFLRRGLEEGQRGVYITLEESRERIINTADEKGWEFSEYVDAGDLAVVDLDPIEMANNLSSIQSDLPRLIDEFDAERLVLDPVSLLEMMYDHPARRRSEVFEFSRALKDAGVTTLVTSEASEDSAYASRFGIIEYLADGVFVLQYVRPSDFRETRLAVEIQKIRDANHSRETKPYEITGEGISVYRQANIF